MHYRIQHSGITREFKRLATAKKVAQTWANNTGLTLRVNKIDATGHVYEAAIVHPKQQNASIRKYKKGRLSGYEAATGRAVKWFKGRSKATKAERKAKRQQNAGACQGSGWKMNPIKQTLAFPTKASAQKFASEHGLKVQSIRKNPAYGKGGKASGAGAGGAGGGAGAGSQGGASRTEVRSPTRTSTATHAKTTGNITVTGGAGRGATTTVTIKGGKKKNPHTMAFRTKSAMLAYAAAHGLKVKSIRKAPKHG